MSLTENVNADSNLKTLQENINQLETRFEKLREDVVANLTECGKCITTAKQLCSETVQMNSNLENKLANVSNEEKEWKDIKVKLATTSIKGKVVLDVGGERYVTSVETLIREENTFFTALFSKQWELERDPDDKSVFIDRDGKLFYHILSYLRTGVVPDIVYKDETLHQNLLIEAKFFCLDSLIDKLWIRFSDTTLLTKEQGKKLNEFYGENTQGWALIYKASRDGFDASAFHSRCNDKGPTMTIIRSNNGYLFGGYTSISWTSDGSYKTDDKAFIFTLTNPHNIPPTKYLIKPDQVGSAVNHDGGYGPTFGGGHDIYLSNGSNSNNSSYCNFPNSYNDTTGQGDNTFTGARNFTTSDIEVFKLV